jgi:iron-sulfur cluster repair protein YtfE (RIC family)
MLGDYKLKLDDTVNNQQRIISETVEQTQKELNNKKEQLDKTIQNIVSEFGNIDKMRKENADALSNTLATIEKRYDNVMKEKVKQLDLYLERVKQFMDESMPTQEKR